MNRKKDVRENCILNQSWEHSRLRFSRVSQLKFEANRSKDSWSDKQTYRDLYTLYYILVCSWTQYATDPFKPFTDKEWRNLPYLSSYAHLIVEDFVPVQPVSCNVLGVKFTQYDNACSPDVRLFTQHLRDKRIEFSVLGDQSKT